MSDAFFPFYALGYACNPFRSLTAEEWAHIAVVDAPLIQAAERGAHIQVMGRKGRGKTSTLRGLQAHFERRGLHTIYERIPPGQHRLQTAPTGADVLLLDEVQRLALRGRGRVVALAREHQVVLGTHLTYRPDFALRGLSLRTVRLANHGYAHIRRVVRARLAYFTRTDPPALTLSDAAIRVVHKKFGSDLRAAEFYLYDVFQQAAAEGLKGQIRPGDLQRLASP